MRCDPVFQQKLQEKRKNKQKMNACKESQMLKHLSKVLENVKENKNNITRKDQNSSIIDIEID